MLIYTCNVKLVSNSNLDTFYKELSTTTKHVSMLSRYIRTYRKYMKFKCRIIVIQFA